MIFEKFVRIVKAHRLIETGDRIVVAVSGGADSMALLHLLRELQPVCQLDLVVAHLNHGLRGKESDDDEEFVKQTATDLRLPVHARRIASEALAELHGENLEEWARRWRFDFLRSVAETQRAQKVALGHTMNDQAETVLMRLIRGSGTKGLAGIPAVREDLFIRPLLGVQRDEILLYLGEHSILWREDSSNQDLNFFRNRVRAELLPLLKRSYNPQIVPVLARTALLLREDAETLARWAESVSAKEALVASDGITWDVPKFLEYPRGLQRYLVKHTLEQLTLGYAGISARHVDWVMELLQLGKSGKMIKVAGIRVTREYQTLRFRKLELAGQGGDFDYWLSLPGEVEVVEAGSLFRACIDKGIAVRKGLSQWEFFLDSEELETGLHVRNWREGDSYSPSGYSEVKNLKELFADKRIPISQRRYWPVITLNNKIILVKDFPLSADMKDRAGSARQTKVILEERKLEA